MVLDPTFDGHAHSPFCPHGTLDPLADYVAQARARGLRRLAVTEHLPLPAGFVDPMGPFECAMAPARLPDYLAAVEAEREQHTDVELLVGLEVDWLGSAQGGWHEQVLELLGPVHARLAPEATVLSVHFVGDGIVDGTPEHSRALAPGQPADAYHLAYYAALAAALSASWQHHGRDLRPRRIGHFTLPRKFIRALPLADPARVEAAALAVLERVAAEGLQLDLNVAGLDRETCGETYLPEPYLTRARELGIPLVYGSDAHRAADVGRHLDIARRVTAA